MTGVGWRFGGGYMSYKGYMVTWLHGYMVTWLHEEQVIGQQCGKVELQI